MHRLKDHGHPSRHVRRWALRRPCTRPWSAHDHVAKCVGKRGLPDADTVAAMPLTIPKGDEAKFPTCPECCARTVSRSTTGDQRESTTGGRRLRCTACGAAVDVGPESPA